MSLRNVIEQWLEVVEPGQLDLLSPDDQRQFCTDVVLSEPDWTYDWMAEGFNRLPQKRAEFEQALGSGDFLQAGAIADLVRRKYIIEVCREYWESEFTQIHEQNSDYTGDE